MTIVDYMPFIAVGILVIAGIAGVAHYLIKKNKSQKLTAKQIPRIPSQKEASSRFEPASAVQATTVNPKSLIRPPAAVKRVILGMLIFFTASVVVGVSYYISQARPQPVQKIASANPEINNSLHRETTIGEVRADKLVAGATFGYYNDADAAVTTAQPTEPVNVTLKINTYFCPNVSDPYVQSCATKTGTDTQLGVLNWGDKQIEIVGGVLMKERCGVYQVDSTFTPYNQTEADPGKGGSAVYNWGRACDESATSAKTASTAATLANGQNQPVTSITPSPTPTLTPTPTTASSRNNSSTAPTATPTPTPTLKPTLTPPAGSNSVPLTITPSATPSPTEIILARASVTPTSNPPTKTPNLSPTLPSAGFPFPAIAIAIPLLLIIVAFAI